MADTWYVTSGRAAVNWGAAVVGGVAQTAIYRVVQNDDLPFPLEFLFAVPGTKISAADVTAAQAGTSGDAIPAGYTPTESANGYDRVLVLDPDESVPAGTPDETVIVRRTA